jgi:hypothetical protein
MIFTANPVHGASGQAVICCKVTQVSVPMLKTETAESG